MRHRQRLEDDNDGATPPTAAVRSLYSRARGEFETGRRPIARALYQQCIALDPDHAEAHGDLGIMAAQEGDDPAAIRLFERAAALKPGYAEALDNLCFVLARSGRPREAAQAGTAAVAACPERASGSFNLGVALEALGNIEAAVQSFQSSVSLEPGLAAGWLKLANLLRRLNQLDAALASIDRSIALEAAHHGARVIRGLILDALGRSLEAEADFAAAFALCPAEAEALNFLGAIYIDQGRVDLAAKILHEAVRLGPGNAELHGNLGLALQRQGRTREAFDAYVRAVTLEPENVVAQCNLGGLLLDINEVETAVSTCRLATRFDPSCLQAQVYLGLALRRQGHLAEALGAFREALRHRPDAGEASIELCDLRLHACDWPGLDAERPDALARTCGTGKRVPPFQVLTLTGSPIDQLQAARTWAAGFRSRAAPLAPYQPRSRAAQASRLRIGYLSADFRTHATAMLIAEVFELHDRGAFEIFGYSYGADDASALRRRLAGALDHVVDLRTASHRDAARKIHADGIDILIDLKGYTRDARPEILAPRPAPIQVNYLGYPGTMGAEFIDYIIADSIVAPSHHAAFFDEKIVRLPCSYQPNDSRRPIARQPPTRGACGLPAEGFVFCCLNSSYKITPEIFDIWMRLLRDTPGSVLWLYEGDGAATGNLRREAAARGVEPRRLVFAPKIMPEAHLARLTLADLFLDTLPVNAHTTASEALWAGVPVVTCLGEAFASRVAASLLHAVGLPDLVTSSLADYEALASSLAGDRNRLAAIRARLHDGRATTPLFDTRRYTRAFEAALRRMAELRDEGRPPEAFSISDGPKTAIAGQGLLVG